MNRDRESAVDPGELSASQTERMTRYVDGSMKGEERSRFELEILEDSRLAEAIYTEVNLREAIGGAADDVTRARMREVSEVWQPARWLRIALPAAALVVFAILAPRLFDSGVDDGSTTPSGEGRRLRSPSAPETSMALFPTGSSDELPTFFKWTRHPSATSYRLEVRDDSAALVFSTDTADTSIPFPGSALGSLAGSDLNWRVVPKTGETELSPSESLQFRFGR